MEKLKDVKPSDEHCIMNPCIVNPITVYKRNPSMSLHAKALYGILIDLLVYGDGWIDEDGEYFVEFSIYLAEMYLMCGVKTANKVFDELEGKGLIRCEFRDGNASDTKQFIIYIQQHRENK